MSDFSSFSIHMFLSRYDGYGEGCVGEMGEEGGGRIQEGRGSRWKYVAAP